MVKNKKIEYHYELLECVKEMIKKIKPQEISPLALSTALSQCDIVEDFFLGNAGRNLITNLIAEENREELHQEYGIENEVIEKIKQNPAIMELAEDENPKITPGDYQELKEDALIGFFGLEMKNFISDYEQTILFNECIKEIEDFKKWIKSQLKKLVEDKDELAKHIKTSVGFTDKSGNFKDLQKTSFDYFNKYSDEQLDEIYKQTSSQSNKDAIDEVRKERKQLKKQASRKK